MGSPHLGKGGEGLTALGQGCVGSGQEPWRLTAVGRMQGPCGPELQSGAGTDGDELSPGLGAKGPREERVETVSE